jgi:hypothetical protein
VPKDEPQNTQIAAFFFSMLPTGLRKFVILI